MPKEEKKIEFTPFGTPIRSDRFIFDGIGEKNLAQFGLELDKETGSSVVVQKDPLDLHELIQSYKDDCGMEFVQKMLSRGLARPEDFAAQPGDFGDSSTLPDNINDAYQQSLENAKLGVDLGQFKSQKDIEDYVIAQVKAQLAAQQNQQITQTQQGDKQ